jgi:RNA polymerase sigma-70 factor (ECF subfamily)
MPTDELILELFSNENTRNRAFEMLVKKYQRDVYQNVRRIVGIHEDANDVSQNVFIKIWRYLDSFRGESSLKTWILRICTNESLTFIEKKKKLLNLTDDSYTDWMLHTIPDEIYLSSDKIIQLIQQAIIQLPEKQRVVFSLRYYEEMPYEEMSKVLNTSEGALKASYHFAVKKVESFLLNNN